jgi:polygalacturonase
VKELPCVVDTNNANSDLTNINRAIVHANAHNIPTVVVPYRNSGYVINAPIEMKSNVHLHIECGATIKLADDSNIEMIHNAFNTSETLTDKNIEISGGVWDGNGPNQSKWVEIEGQSTLVVMFKFVGVDGLKIHDIKIRNSKSYGILIGNSKNIDIYNANVDVGDTNNPANGDGIHFLGPCSYIRIEDCIVHSEDNCIAFNADDVDHGYGMTMGAIDHILVHNVYINNTDWGQGALFLSALHPITDVVVDGFYGTASYAMKFVNFDIFENGPGWYDRIHVSNVDFKCNYKMYAIGFSGDFGYDVTFDNIHLECYSATEMPYFFAFSIIPL